MVKHLHEDFLHSDREYREAKRYWAKLCRKSVLPSQRNLWKKWLSEYDDRDDEAATMASLYDPKSFKGFSIVQLKPNHKQRYVGARMDTFGASVYKNPINFIPISCELSDEAAVVVGKLIRAWSDPAMNDFKMSKMIKRILKH